MTKTVSILLPIPAERPYTYSVPEGLDLLPGDFVTVPLGPREVAAVVWETPEGGGDKVNVKKLREVVARFDCPPLAEEMRRFVEWVANYTLSAPGMVLRMVLRVKGGLDPLTPIEGWIYSGKDPERITPARSQVLELVREGMAWSKSGLAHAAGVSGAVVTGLIKQGVLNRVEIPQPAVVALPRTDYVVAKLNADQSEAADKLRQSVAKKEFSVTLIDGVTGSGKTEVYFEAIAACLEQGRQVLILLPEIALTSAFLKRFEARFGAPPAEWHSDISPKMREKTWRQVAEGQVRVVAGARSSLFLPFQDLGLIIVDEEHEQAYKQQDRVFYNARDMAVVRGHLGNATVVLASATPSIESRVNGDQGRYQYLRLEQRFGDAKLPDIGLIDMRKYPPSRGRFLSPVLVSEIAKTLERKEQVLLFLNRRGYAPLTLCRVCGHRFQCNNCSTWLVEHRFRKQLQCHHCGHHEASPEACPECGTLDHLVACGPGVERVGEEILELFPDARTIVLSSDMAGGVKRMRVELEAIAKGEADIVIGTQLVAKGHNFPLMTLVGVVDADLGLAHGDLRASERTFQLLSQVTGRAGRAGGKSLGLLQSYQPEHPVLQAICSGDREAFYEREIEARKAAALPPFGRLAGIIISADNRQQAEIHAKALRRTAPMLEGVNVLGPAEAPLSMIRGRYRFRILVQAQRNIDLQNWIRGWFALAPKERGGVRVQVDIDPQSFM
ncbi:MAG: primosomal protein N' [Hyphomicrobiales bacterium]|nr:MAG: primosomal protein N' [Hyphomicrobiales bacterium]